MEPEAEKLIMESLAVNYVVSLFFVPLSKFYLEGRREMDGSERDQY